MFSTTQLVSPAAFPRYHGATIEPTDRLKLAYIKYKNTDKIPDDFVQFNIVMCHGTSMNKSIWKFYIDKLFKNSATTGKAEKWAINSIIAYDIAVHGDSAQLNQGKMGWLYRWEDGGRDINSIVKHEQLTSGDYVPDSHHRNILVGHSLGGTQSVFATTFEPNLYDSIFLIDPVLYGDEKSHKKFTKLLPLLNMMYNDQFDSEEDIDEYLQNGFLANFHPEVLQHLIEDEKYFDKEAGLWKTKASKIQQLSIYMGAFHSVTYVMGILHLLTTPVIHIGVSDGKFNAPQNTPFLREKIPSELLTTYDLQGEHLINGESPEAVLECIFKTLSARGKSAHGNIDSGFYPELKYNHDRQKIFREKWDQAYNGGFLEEEKPKL